MVPAAEATQVPAVGGSAVGVDQPVVDVAAAWFSPAAGHPAGPVANLDEPLLGGRRRGPPDARRWPQGIPAGGLSTRRGVDRSAAAGAPAAVPAAGGAGQFLAGC